MYTYVAQPDGGVAGGRASDGATVWRASIGHAGYPPVIVGSMLFADAQKQGEATEAVVAVRATDGHVLWTTHFPNTDFYALVNADSTTVAVGGAHYGLYTLDAATGAIRWHVATSVFGKPQLSAGVIAAVVSPSPTGSPFSIAAYQASDGKLLWNTPYRGFTTHFEVSATRLFGVNESRQPVARSLQDGRLLWTGATAGVPIGLTPSAVILASGQSLTALSQQDGSLLWQAPIDPGGLAGSYTLPVVNNTLFLVTPNGLVAVRASDGAPVWHFNYPPGQAESVIVADGMVYLAGTTAPDGGDQEICALNISDGSVRWRHTIQSAQLLAEPIAGSQERVSTHALA